MKNYLIKNGPAFLKDGSRLHKVWVFDQEDALQGNELDMALKWVEIGERNEDQIIQTT